MTGLPVPLGGRCDDFANFEGKLDEVAVYERVLPASEVAAHFKSGSLSGPIGASVTPERPARP